MQTLDIDESKSYLEEKKKKQQEAKIELVALDALDKEIQVDSEKYKKALLEQRCPTVDYDRNLSILRRDKSD